LRYNNCFEIKNKGKEKEGKRGKKKGEMKVENLEKIIILLFSIKQRFYCCEKLEARNIKQQFLLRCEKARRGVRRGGKGEKGGKKEKT